ncbi:MAG: hypothetical protein EA361_19545 [Bacteroidetes bacterium]|nr:MAG: hypothetical protein EA361_19545 [Bacteroidota bacterium]
MLNISSIIFSLKQSTMKKLLLTSFAITLLALGGFSQTHIAVQSNGEASFYSNFANALAAATAGDTIYLPGGNFYIGTINIDKKLTIIGVGHYPEYTQASGITQLDGTIRFVEGADHSQLQGVYLTGNIILGSGLANQVVNYLMVSRCNMSNIYLSYDGSAANDAMHLYFSENVIRSTVYGGYVQYVQFSKNIIGGGLRNLNSNAIVRNNIFLTTSSGYLAYLESVVFENNVFLSTANPIGFSTATCTFNNNIFVNNFSLPVGFSGSGNVVNKPFSQIFVNHTGGSFSYESDFQLAETSEGIGAGTDGNDIGIYGTSVPYKEGAVPFNPRIVSGQISPETDEDGNIQININVEAQQR